MIKKTKKICKGTSIAKGFKTCEQPVYRFKLGMCQKCYGTFLYTTEAGKEHIKKTTLRVRNKFKKQAKAKDKQKLEQMQPKPYWEKKLQYLVNSIAREIDAGHNCISSNRKMNAKYDAGHYYSVGSSPSIRFNLHNIFAQSVSDNQYKGGNPIQYIKNIERLFGVPYAEKLTNLRADYPVIKLSIPELKECIQNANNYLKWLRKYKTNNYVDKFTQQERIELRIEANIAIGIYED